MFWGLDLRLGAMEDVVSVQKPLRVFLIIIIFREMALCLGAVDIVSPVPEPFILFFLLRELALCLGANEDAPPLPEPLRVTIIFRELALCLGAVDIANPVPEPFYVLSFLGSWPCAWVK